MKNETPVTKLFSRGLLQENTIFRQAISLCPAIAVTSTVKNGFMMGIAVLFVQAMVNVSVSSIRRWIHPRIRLPIFMLISSGWVTITDMCVAAFAPDIYATLGLYIQLIVAFASILAAAESFASKNGVIASFFDGVGRGTGFTLALIAISAVREVLGKGTILDIPVLFGSKPLLIMILPAGGFITAGILMALFNYLDKKFSNKATA